MNLIFIAVVGLTIVGFILGTIVKMFSFSWAFFWVPMIAIALFMALVLKSLYDGGL